MKDDVFKVLIEIIKDALQGPILGFIVAILLEMIRSKQSARLEVAKMHDRDRLLAYKALLGFSKCTMNVAFTDDDPKESFIASMKRAFDSNIYINYPYYSKDIIKILDTLDSIRNFIMNSSTDIDASKIDAYFRNDFRNDAKILDREIRRKIAIWSNY